MGFEEIAAQAAAGQDVTNSPAAEGVGDGFIRPDVRENDQTKPSPSPLSEGSEEDPIKNDPNDQWAKKFSRLAQTERQMLMERQKIKKEMDDFQRQRQEFEQYKEEVQRWKQRQELKEKDPLAWLEEEELPYDQLSEKIVNHDEYSKGAEYRQIMRRLEQIEKTYNQKLEDLTQFKENSTKKEQDQQIEQYYSQVKDFIGQNAEKYELISSMGDSKIILEMQGQYYKQHGQLADIDKLCQQYETYLEKELFDNQLNKMQKLKKYQQRMGLSEKAQGQEPQANQREQINPFSQQKTPPTLNNSLTSETPPQKRPNTREERMRRAMEILEAKKSL